MRVSIIFTLFFTVYLTSQASKAESTCVNVNHTDNGTKSFRLRGSGHTCGDFPLVVSKTGFQLKVYTSPKSTTPNQGYLRIYFGNVSVPFSFVNSPAELSIYTSNDIYLGRAILGVTTIEIQSNGVGFVAPQKTSFASIKIPSLEEFQRYQQDKVIIKFKIEWTNVNDLVIELPNFINNTKNSPPKLTTKTPKSTKTVNYTGNNESITNSAILTSTARATSNATSKASWIVIAAVGGCVFVIIVIAAVVGAVLIFRRIRRKRSGTAQCTHCPLSKRHFWQSVNLQRRIQRPESFFATLQNPLLLHRFPFHTQARSFKSTNDVKAAQNNA